MNPTRNRPKYNEVLLRWDLSKMRTALWELKKELSARGGARDLLRLKQVDAALRKMDAGGYGQCEFCKRPIDRERLLAEPFVRYCVACF
jgi:RNA polymerase-binding transcription factor DksA